MGYTTYFSGHVAIEPPLNEHEIAYLRKFSGSRRMARTKGGYYANPGTNFGQSDEGDVLDSNVPDPSQPGLWCQWVPTDDGCAIEWDDGEKFYSSAEWMAYLIDTFLRPGATAERDLRARTLTEESNLPASRLIAASWVIPEEFAHFTFDHLCNGEIDADGEAPDDLWQLVVRDNVVSVKNGYITYVDEPVGDNHASPVRVSATRADRPHDDQHAITNGQPALASGTTVHDAELVN